MFLATAGAATVIAVVVGAAATSRPTATVVGGPTRPPAAEPTVAPDVSPQSQPTTADEVFVSVPELTLLSVAEARRALAAAGLDAGPVTFVGAPYPRDTVVESFPGPGRQVSTRTAVELRVASGANLVPDVRARTRAEAEAAVVAAGFTAAFASYPAAPGTVPGAIVGSAPGAGEALAVGELVTIFEAVPEEPRPSPTTSSEPSPSPSPTSTPLPTPTPTPAGVARLGR